MTGERIEDLDEQVVALETTLGDAKAVTAAFDAEMRRMQATVSDTGREVGSLSRSMSRGLRGAFEGLVFDGAKLSDALKGVASSMVGAAYNSAVNPVAKGLGGALSNGVQGLVGSLLPFAKGGSFAQGRVMPFANGGVVSGPTTFPMRGGTGLMGEAGPEAIMPLSRGADGRLGVRAGGGGQPVNVTVNVTTPDVEGFRRSQSQIAAQMGRALSRGQRNR